MTSSRPTPRPTPVAPTTVPTVLAVLAVVAALLVPLAVTLLVRADDTDHGRPLGAALDGADRRALAPVRLRRGPTPPPVDPTVDLRDPVAVASAYVTAARAAGPDDAGRTHLQAAGYAVPGSPPAAVGVVVLDPPPAGQVRTAAVTALDLVHQDVADTRRGYRAAVTTVTGPPGGGAPPAVTTAYLVLARQPDGHWLVAADTPDVPEGDD